MLSGEAQPLALEEGFLQGDTSCVVQLRCFPLPCVTRLQEKVWFLGPELTGGSVCVCPPGATLEPALKGHTRETPVTGGPAEGPSPAVTGTSLGPKTILSSSVSAKMARRKVSHLQHAS